MIPHGGSHLRPSSDSTNHVFVYRFISFERFLISSSKVWFCDVIGAVFSLSAEKGRHVRTKLLV